MDERWLQVREHTGEGYKPVVASHGWRVAILHHQEAGRSERLVMMERHRETDEAFVLARGRAIMLIGGDGPRVGGIATFRMEPAKIYNVLCNAWHQVLLSPDATVLIVEDDDTGEANSEYTRLGPRLCAMVQEVAEREGVS